MSGIQIITRESFLGIVCFVVWIVFCWLVDFGLGLLLGIVLLLAWVWAFRNPERAPVDRSGDMVLAPIDGRISNIEQKDKRVWVSIEVTFFDVGLVRTPQEINSIKLARKSGLVACLSPLHKELNETMSAEISGGIACVIHLYPRVLKQARFYTPIAYRLGERMGFMKLGTLVLELPDSVKLHAQIGGKIRGGTDVLGYIKHEH